MWVICSKCKKHKALWAFSRKSDKPLGISYLCKSCDKKFYKIYYKNNRDKIIKRVRTYCRAHKEKYAKKSKKYYAKHKDKIKKMKIKYYNKNKDIILEKCKKYSHQKAKFKSFADKLTIEESPRLAKDGISLEVKCKYCRKYYIPTNNSVIHRIKTLNSENYDNYKESNLYCSEECKQACPIYNNHGSIPGMSLRESLPKELRNEVLQRNGGMCELCGKHPIEEIHHEKPVATHPHLQLDKDNLWGVCKECHYKVLHKLAGCTLVDLKDEVVKKCKKIN